MQTSRNGRTLQPRVLADILDGMTPDWDEIVRRARLTRNAHDHDELEQLAQRFADALIRGFRGPGARRPSAGPLAVTDGGAC